jgi:23S rRNA (guanosine2251-2'-O)-methyltransferase
LKEWIYGRNAVYETLRAGRRHLYRLKLAAGAQVGDSLSSALELARKRSLPIEEVRRKELDGISDGHQGIALQAGDYPYVGFGELLKHTTSASSPPFLLILDTLQDPQNLGTLLRTAEVVGVHGVILPQHRTATVTPAVVNASSGASEHLWISQHNLAQAISEFKKGDIWVIGLEADNQAQPLDKVHLDGAIALVVGSEGEGMRRLVRESCDVLLRLPMQGQIASLNAAVAGSVALYMVWQAREFG